MHPIRTLTAAVALAASAASPCLAQDLGNLADVASGLSSPLYVCSEPANANRLFVVQRGGQIRLLINGVLQGTNFLDVASSLTPNTGTVQHDPGGGVQTYNLVRGSEQGLLGLALAPDYATSGVFYINYVQATGNYSYSYNSQTMVYSATDLGRTVIVRMQRSAANPNVADPAQDVIFAAAQPYSNHNGGNIQFGPDGYLYCGMGDGGSGNDPGNRALNPNNILGKMLRLDVSSDDFPADPERDYAIPEGNPFESGGGLPEIWAVGLRNPWRWSFDRLLGNLWIADVGQGVWEEVNVVPGNGGAGRNYGWRVREGLVSTGLSSGGYSTANLTDPVYVYSHGNGATQGFSITGGYVYRGSVRGWRGRYFFSDYVNPKIWSARYVDGAWSDFQDFTPYLSNLTTGAISSIASYGEDANGELYIVQLNGRVRKIVPQLPQPCAADFNGAGGVTVQDIYDFLAAWQARLPLCDFNADQTVSVQDLYDYFSEWAIPCP